jgi:hypothetical protein
MDLKSLLETSTATFTRPPQFPAGHYKVQITRYDFLPFEWAKKGTFGLMYVPTIQPVEVILSGDENVDAEQNRALEEYGDWTKREFQFAYTKKEDNRRMAQVSEINFPLFETNQDGSEGRIMERQAARFHVTPEKNQGQEGGFIHDVLGLSFPQGASVGDLAEATLNKFFIVNFEYEENQDPQRPPNLIIPRGGVAAA